MKQLLTAFAMCQSMFCAIPFPLKLWEERQRDNMLICLPLVGLEIGAIWMGLWWLCRVLALPKLVAALGLSLYPYLATGFLHLDGFMDVTDAVRSWRDLDRRREILKDSHVGSFAVIGLAMVLLAQFAFLAATPEGANGKIFLFLPAVSRCCSALAVMGLPPMSTSQYVQRKRSIPRMAGVAGMLAIFLGAGFLLCGKYGWVLIGCLAGYALALHRGYRSLQGMNGDISGYALTLGELCALGVYALL